MEERYFYNTIENPGRAEYKAGDSKFIGIAFPVKDIEACKLRRGEIKKEHPKATHHCFAYRIGLDGNQFRAQDDGEPSGSAGKPILGQIDSRGLTDILIIVVRYFGGSQLGLPGLTQAYRSTAALVLQTIPIVQQAVEEGYFIQFDYTKIHEVMGLVKTCDCRITMQTNGLFCKLRLEIPKHRLAEFSFRLQGIRNVEMIKAD